MKSLDFLKAKGIPFKVIKLAEEPKTAQDVERLYGCPLKQVLKTVVFIGEAQPLLVVVPGDQRVDLDKLKEAAGQRSLRLATAVEVQNATGYTIGGVTPLGADKSVKLVFDAGVTETPTVNIGSGKAEIGLELKSADLVKALQPLVVRVTKA